MKQKRTRCQKDIVKWMLTYIKGKTSFNKFEFLQWLCYQLRLHDQSEIDQYRLKIGGVYHALTNRGFMKRVAYKRTITEIKEMQHGLEYLLTCKYYDVNYGKEMRSILTSSHQLHYLELEEVDPEELIKFKNLLRDEVK